MMNPFEELQIDPSANAKDIEAAYRRRAAETHPDHGGDADEFKRVKDAYELLTNDDFRADQSLGLPPIVINQILGLLEQALMQGAKDIFLSAANTTKNGLQNQEHELSKQKLMLAKLEKRHQSILQSVDMESAVGVLADRMIKSRIKAAKDAIANMEVIIETLKTIYDTLVHVRETDDSEFKECRVVWRQVGGC